MLIFITNLSTKIYDELDSGEIKWNEWRDELYRQEGETMPTSSSVKRTTDLASQTGQLWLDTEKKRLSQKHSGNDMAENTFFLVSD